MGEMLKRSGGIGEKAQCDPPGHEVELGTVVGIGRRAESCTTW